MFSHQTLPLTLGFKVMDPCLIIFTRFKCSCGIIKQFLYTSAVDVVPGDGSLFENLNNRELLKIRSHGILVYNGLTSFDIHKYFEFVNFYVVMSNIHFN